MATTRTLTELEGCVLGLFWAKGPCTAYAVRMEFLESPSAHWSGSAGAIYPLVERLKRRRLLHAEAHAEGRRKSQRYHLTAEGLKRFRAWLAPPLSEEAAGVPPDPLRTRLRFLGALTSVQQAAFLANAQEQVREQLPKVEADAARFRGVDPYSYWMARAAAAALQARLTWLPEIALELEQRPRP
jgi:DNA-binding PadR family transcriptional regulator